MRQEERLMAERFQKKRVGQGKKCLLSLGFGLCLAVGLLPLEVRAKQGEDGLCPHHMAHTEECGFRAAVEGEAAAAACAHEHDAVCGYAQGHECSHIHDERCGFFGTGDGNPCIFVCRICPVQDLIDALPGAEEITAENRETVEAQLAAVGEARKELSDEESGQLIHDRYDAAVAKITAIQNPETGEPDASGEEASAGEMAAAYTGRDSVYIHKTEITTGNCNNVLAGTDNDGKVTYDLDTHTLTLNGVNLDITHTSKENTGVIRTTNKGSGRNDLIIRLLGENKIRLNTASTADSGRTVINVIDALTFTGDGSLEVELTTSATGPTYAIRCGRDLVFDHTTVKAIAGDCGTSTRRSYSSYAICTAGAIQIKGGKITAKSGKAAMNGDSKAIMTTGDTETAGNIEISDQAEVNAEAVGKGDASQGIYANGELHVSGSKVSAVGSGEINQSCGIYVKKLALDGGEITAQAGEAAAYSWGIYAEDIKVNGGKITAKGGNAAGGSSYGVSAGQLTIADNSELTAEAGTAGAYSMGIWSSAMDVNGTVTAKGGAASGEGAESYGISAASFLLRGGDVRAEAGEAAAWSFGLWTKGAEISAGTLTAIAGQAAETNAISSVPTFTDGYAATVQVRAGESEMGVSVVPEPTEETYYGSKCVIIGSGHVHVWAEACTSDETHHWHVCTAEGCNLAGNPALLDSYGTHSYDGENDADCNICGAKREVSPKPEPSDPGNSGSGDSGNSSSDSGNSGSGDSGNDGGGGTGGAGGGNGSGSGDIGNDSSGDLGNIGNTGTNVGAQSIAALQNNPDSGELQKDGGGAASSNGKTNGHRKVDEPDTGEGNFLWLYLTVFMAAGVIYVYLYVMDRRINMTEVGNSGDI